MDSLKGLQASIEGVLLDPANHDVLSLVKGVRNGIVYGTKVRFPHALVMIFLFRSGTVREKVKLIFRATRQHARNLGLFALLYKSSMLALRQTSPDGRERELDSFIAGLVGGYWVFGRGAPSSVTQQIVIYVFARVALALAKLAVRPAMAAASNHHAAITSSSSSSSRAIAGGWGLIKNEKVRNVLLQNGWTVFASLSWATVMFLFRWHPDVIQPSMRSSMNYIYLDSDEWDSLRNFIWHNK